MIPKLAIQTGLVHLYEVEQGQEKARRIHQRKPVVEYLKLQTRFQHLFEAKDEEHLAAIQAIADANIARYRLEG